MAEWWDAFSGFEKVFWYIAIPFSFILLIQMILTFVGMGGSDADVGGSGMSDFEADTDFDTTDDVSDDMDIESSFHFFTVRNFIAFFTLFGWTGIAAFQNGYDKTWTIILAVIGGLIAMIIVSALFYFISKLVDSGGALKIRNALNQIGSVYIPIKANAENVGKVQISIQGSLREMDAITKGSETLKTGTVVKVVGIVSNKILVVQKVAQK